jgi:predicted small metal-binding protein
MRYDCSEVSTVGFKLKCPMSGCTAELTGENKEDLLKQGMENAKTHGMAALSPDMMSKLRNAIKPA